MANMIRKQATSCTIGAVTFTEIQYFGYRPIYTGPGGVAVSPKYVANTKPAVDKTEHHVSYTLKIGIDADEVSALYSTGYTTPGTAVTPLTVTESGVLNDGTRTGKTRVITFTAAYLQEIAEPRFEEGAEHQIVEVIFLLLAAPSFGAWT